jgi:hypothetical protein
LVPGKLAQSELKSIRAKSEGYFVYEDSLANQPAGSPGARKALVLKRNVR